MRKGLMKKFKFASIIIIFLIVPLSGFFTAVSAQVGTVYDLSWATNDNGGGESVGTMYRLTGTAGQHDAGSLMSGTLYQHIGGFWAGVSGSVVTVPNGEETGTTLLQASPVWPDVRVQWDAVTQACVSSDYNLVWGWGSDLSQYIVSGSDCSLDTSGDVLWSTSPDTISDWCWFLVVGHDSIYTEGGWGLDSAGTLRSTTPSGYCYTLTIDNTACIP